MIIELPGNPIPLKRARAGKNGFYDSQYIVKKNIREFVRLSIKDELKPILGEVELKATFHMQIPKSWSKKKKREMLGKPHLQRPDLSNFLKFYEDCFLEMLYADDSQIYKIDAVKIWAEEGKTILEIVSP
jgi:Holliday junction resolvase RusA-like endonuclease